MSGTWKCRGGGKRVEWGDRTRDVKGLFECPERRCLRLFMVDPSRPWLPPHKRPICGEGDEHGCLCLERVDHTGLHKFQ